MSRISFPLRPVMVFAVALSAACADSTGPQTSAEVTVSFASAPAASAAPSAPALVDAPGSNGTLTIDEIQIVVDEFKLERAEDSCETGEDEACEQFEAPPYFLDLPLDAVPVDLASGSVGEGEYRTLKLETKDLEASGGEDASEAETLADQVVAAYPEWPESASLRVAGSFDAEDGSDPVPFVVYLTAEVKVELSFDPPMIVTSDAETVGVVVEVDPVAWFTRDDGTVWDLSEFDFETTGDVIDFEAKMGDGFTKIEVDG